MELVDGVIVIAGRYPDGAGLIDWLELPPEVLGCGWAEEPEESECCCHGHHHDGCHHEGE